MRKEKARVIRRSRISDGNERGSIDPGNYVAGVGSLDNAIDVLRMIADTKIDGKAILYPHISKTPLRMVDYWQRDDEVQLLNERLIGAGI